MNQSVSNDVVFAFVILASKHSDESGCYWLQGNRHLRGPNFFGGHVEACDASPLDAASRELLEEIGDEELRDHQRWALDIDGIPALTANPESVRALLRPLHADTPIRLPFHSLRYGRDRVGICHFFLLNLDESPEGREIEARLAWLEGRSHPSIPGLFPAVRLGRNALVAEARRNWANPFLRSYLEKFSPVDLPMPPYRLNPTDLEGRLLALLHERFPDDKGNLFVRLELPDSGDVMDAFRYGDVLRMTLEIRTSTQSEIFRSRLPYPHEGVFVLGEESGMPGEGVPLTIWHPALMARPGYWAIRRFHANGRQVKVLRVASLRGSTIDIPLERVDGKKRGRTASRKIRLPARLGNLPENLLNRLPDPGAVVDEGKLRNLLEPVLECLRKEAMIDWLDDQDLSHQRLYSYSAHILFSFRAFLDRLRVDGNSLLDFWKTWVSNGRQFEDFVFPRKHLQQRGRLQAFRPVNDVDAISRLSALSKYSYRGDSLERLPAVYRQLHPSYRGVICPFESPESKRVGLTIVFAAGASVDAAGHIFPADSDTQDVSTGYAAGLVPFLRHNDAPRAMMGAKNLKQAVPILGATQPRIDTGGSGPILVQLAGLRELGVVSGGVFPAPGIDLLVAYMPFEGLNFEDGIVANRRLQDERLMDWLEDIPFELLIEPGWVLCAGRFGQELWERVQASFFDEGGLRQPGTLVQPWPEGDGVAHVRNTVSGEVRQIRLFLKSEAEILEIKHESVSQSGFASSLRIKLRFRRSLSIGDKLMGRHGNKGVISSFLDSERMPSFPDDPRLPPSLRGRTVDLVLNPNGVISRLNIGQLIETQASLAMELGFQEVKGTQVLDATVREELSAFFAGGRQAPFDVYGRIHLQLQGYEGAPDTLMPVTVGFQYFHRLKQSPQDKAQVRGTPISPWAYSSVTRQPVGGRRRGGGQRLGEMEVWALAAHRANHFLAGCLGEKSDAEFSLRPAGKVEPSTFKAIRDFLFARGFELRSECGQLHLKQAVPCNDELRLLSDSGQMFSRVNAQARCPMCNSSVSIPVRAKERGGYAADVAGLLASFGYDFERDELVKVLAPCAPPFEQVFLLPFINQEGDPEILNVHVSMPGKMTYVGYLNIGGQTYPFKGRMDNKAAFSVEKLLSSSLTCSTHRSSELVVDEKCLEIVAVPKSGGMFDPALFGSDGARFAGIRVPKGRGASGAIEWEILPVLPSRYRQPAVEKERFADEFTDLYARMLEASLGIQHLETQINDQGINTERSTDTDKQLARVAALREELLTALDKKLKGKFGLLRRFGLGRRVNLSGRFVIVPDPDLAWDQCGLPAEALAILLSPRIACWPGLSSLEDCVAEMRAPDFWFGLSTSSMVSSLILRRDWQESLRNVVLAFLDCYPRLHVVLNRAPSLHMYSVMSFRPVANTAEQKWVLRINPLVCAGFGADFDGDEMSVHMPISEEECTEVANLMSPVVQRNLLSVANGKPVAGFSQDMVLGMYLAGLHQSSRKHFYSIFKMPCCQEILDKALVWDKTLSQKLLVHLCIEHSERASELMEDWMLASFGFATESGCSFGYLELLALASGAVIPHTTGMTTNNAVLNEAVDNLVNSVEIRLHTPASAGEGFAALAKSGARGGTEQARQILKMRGFLGLGEVGHSFSGGDNQVFVETSLLHGMTADEAFFAAFNGRSSMIDKKLGTPVAGALTRRLVLAGWGWRVASGNCGTRALPGSVLSCGWISRYQVCTHCYGDVHGVDGLNLNGYPCGLIAAQSFGERGTQLSMQSFHTGQKAISLLDLEQWMSKATELAYEEFISGVREFRVYDSLDERHLKMIWLALRNRKEALDMLLVEPGQRYEKYMDGVVVAQQIKQSPFLQLLLGQSPGQSGTNQEVI